MTQTQAQALNYLEGALVNGFIHDWLVAGPYTIPIEDLTSYTGPDWKSQVAAHYHRIDLPFGERPAEQTHFTLAGVSGEETFTWRVHHCLEDHFVDLTGATPPCHYLRAWACAELEVTTDTLVTATLTANGPADLWLNGQHHHRQEGFALQLPYHHAVSLALTAGRNTLWVQTENVAVRSVPFLLALQLHPTTPEAIKVVLPSAMPLFERRQRLAALFAPAYLEQHLYHREQEIKLKWPAHSRVAGQICVRLQTPNGRIFAEAQPFVRAGTEVNLGKAYQFADGAFQVVLMPTPEEYYEHGLRLQRRIDLQIANGQFSTTPLGSNEERRYQALDHAARRNLNLFSEIAKMALGRWESVKPQVIEQTVALIGHHPGDSAAYLTGLVGMLFRYGQNAAFPLPLKDKIESCIFTCWMQPPILGECDKDPERWSEHGQILWQTCEMLAGQLYPNHTFVHSGQTGAWHRVQGEQRILSWLRKRAGGGFEEWDANGYFGEEILALSHMADLAANDEVAEMAAIVLDKLCFTLAVNSFKGSFASTHGQAETIQIKSARLEATAGISYLLWGQGVFNDSILGLVSLACAEGYQVPELLTQIATLLPEEFWGRERHAGTYEEACDGCSGTWEVNKVTYKTPDFMLASAQDYQPGQPGGEEHIWQATLGPDAVLFVNHPFCLSEENAHRPNFWRGNVRLPRAAQWKDVLVSVHQFPQDDWLAFTHAYLPTWAFDEYTLQDRWAFARKGNGYLALMASGGLEPIWRGPGSLEELRTHGRQTIWFLHLGRAALDGSFAKFQAAILALDMTLQPLSIHTTTLRGDTLDFGWEGPLLVNQQEQPLGNFKHYDNPFCRGELDATVMEIQWLDQLLRLDFSA